MYTCSWLIAVLSVQLRLTSIKIKTIGAILKNGTKNPRTIPNKTPKFIYGAIVGTILGALAVWKLDVGAVVVVIGLSIIAVYVFLMTNKVTGKMVMKLTNGKSQVHLVSIVVVGAMSLAGAHFFNQTFAWHPKGMINKSVQNITSGGVVIDANSEQASLPVKPGDILAYTITVSNIAPAASNNYNDLAFIQMTDTLPDGVEYIGNPSLRSINENLGTLLPGKTILKTYMVKVTSTTDGSFIVNTACFTANSVVKDNPQNGCEIAKIKVSVPAYPTPTPTTPTPATPTTPTPPTASPTPSPVTVMPTAPSDTTTGTEIPPVATIVTTLPTQLPNTGPGDVIIIAAFAVVTGYIIHRMYWYLGSKR